MQKILIISTAKLDIRDNVLNIDCESGFYVREGIVEDGVRYNKIRDASETLTRTECNMKWPVLALGFGWNLATVVFDKEENVYKWFFVKCD